VHSGGTETGRHGLTTDWQGQKILTLLLRKDDVVGYEVSSYGNRLARMLEREVGCQAVPLNPGDLRIIRESRKKTDREDALKPAKYLRDTPEEEQCVVPLVSEREEGFRADISMKEFLKRERVAAVNRLHALYGQAGIINVTKKDLQDRERGAAWGSAGYASIPGNRWICPGSSLRERKRRWRNRSGRMSWRRTSFRYPV
jgi:hypothetical protein